MAIIYTYPQKSQPASADTLLITDSEDNNATKTVTIADIRSAAVSGVESIIAGSNITISPAGGTGNVTVSTTGEAEKIVEVVYNNTGSTINKGQPLHITGVNGTIPTVAVANAGNPALMPVSGLANEDIPTMSSGEMIVSGTLEGINTSGIDGSPAEGVIIYVNDNPGAMGGIDYLTTDAPTGEANQVQNIGIIVKNGGGASGSIQVAAIGRSNATPNLNEGSIFIGDASNQSSTLAISTTAGHVLTSDGNTASWAAIPTQPTDDLATTLVAGNTTGGTDIEMTTSDDIVATASDPAKTVHVDFGILSTARRVQITTDNKGFLTPWMTIDNSSFSLNYGSTSSLVVNNNSIDVETGFFRVKNNNYGRFAPAPLTADRVYTFQDKTGVVPVGPNWNTSIASPTAGQDGYVITWNNTSNEYQLLAAGSSGGIYSGSGSLSGNTIVTQGTNTLAFNNEGDSYLEINASAGTPTADHYAAKIVNSKVLASSVSTGLDVVVDGIGNNANVGIDVVVNGSTTLSNRGVQIRTQDSTAGDNTALFIQSSNGTTGSYAIIALSGQSGFGTGTPDPSAIVDVSSTTQAFYPPRMTTAQMNAIASGSPNEGAILFDTTTKQFMGYNGTSWVILG